MEAYTESNFPDYRNYLREEFLKRLAKNPQYSLRAFARTVGLAPSRVSQLFNQRQGLSKRKAIDVGKKLGFETAFLKHFALLVEARHARSKTQRQFALSKLCEKTNKVKLYESVSDDIFRTISDWWYVAILQLGALDDFQGELAYIEKKLSLDPRIVRSSLERLERLGFVSVKNNRVKIISRNIATTENVPSSAVRSFHRQLLEKATAALEEQGVHERNISSFVMPMDAHRIDEIVELIGNFKEQVHQTIRNHEKTDVYNLGIQLFKLTTRKEQ
jgi:uncharacterized protein (TIGR02147 family)